MLQGPIARNLRRRMVGKAVVAVLLEGMPVSEVARRMGTNHNALYKLLHDARTKLKRHMEAAGLPPQEVLAAFEEG